MGQQTYSIAEQYIPLPLALASNDGSPLKGQKSNTTKALKGRYKDATPPVFTNSLLSDWIPELVILEGMFMLNTTPLGSHRTFADYGQFLISRFIKPHFNSGSNEIHVLFDNPGRLPDNPKHFERKRHDNSAIVKTGHECKTVTSQLLIPRKWREDLVNCRNCKRSLVLFLSRYLLQSIAKYMPRDTRHGL